MSRNRIDAPRIFGPLGRFLLGSSLPERLELREQVCKMRPEAPKRRRPLPGDGYRGAYMLAAQYTTTTPYLPPISQIYSTSSTHCVGYSYDAGAGFGEYGGFSDE